jgi:hypothetical protein
MGRYRWGATQGYQNLKNRDLTPSAMEHLNRWRLDQMLAWEDKRIARAEKEALEKPARPESAVAPVRELTRRRWRRRAR